MRHYLLALLLVGVRTEEVATPSSLLGPRHFNYHPYQSQYLREVNPEHTTKHGPVLFPNDAPPPPRPPLIVTSRPITESVSRSELNPETLNNTLADSSRVNSIYRPQVLTNRAYRPLVYNDPLSGPSDYDYDSRGYSSAKEIQLDDRKRTQYQNQEPPNLPPHPIYKVFADYARQREKKVQHKNNHNYHNHEPDYISRQQSERQKVDDYGDDNQNSNYAFSYTVRDQKSGDDFSHKQQSSGSATKGEYRVRLPDGRMQIVSYTADDNGYKADVRYDDEDKTAGNSIDSRHNEDLKSKKNIIYNNKYYEQPYGNNINQGLEYYGFNDKTEKSFQASIKENQIRDYYGNKGQPVTPKYYQPDGRNQVYNSQIRNDYYNYQDGSSTEYNNDYTSLEYDGKDDNYAPHQSKFSNLIANHNLGVIVVPNTKNNKQPTVRPSYDQLKYLFVTRKPTTDASGSTNHNYLYSNIPVEINVPSTTPLPQTSETTTEHVVLIGNKNLYTSVHSSVSPPQITPSQFVSSALNYVDDNSIPVTSLPPNLFNSVSVTPLPHNSVYSNSIRASPTPFSSLYSTSAPNHLIKVTPSPDSPEPDNSIYSATAENHSPSTTPRGFFSSTISHLKNKVHNFQKPILSQSFIDKINRYLKL